MTYFNIKFEHFFDGRDISDGLQSLEHRYTNKEKAVSLAAFWRTQFPKAKITVQKVTVEDLED